MSQWKTIDSAPRAPYQRYLGWCVYSMGAEIRLVHNDHLGRPVAYGIPQDVTHWMPLPEPPGVTPDQDARAFAKSEGEDYAQLQPTREALLSVNAQQAKIITDLMEQLSTLRSDHNELKAHMFWDTENYR